MSDTAYKRLSALMEFTEMGSGYKIAHPGYEAQTGKETGKDR